MGIYKINRLLGFLQSVRRHRSIILLAVSLVMFACNGLLEEAVTRSAWIDCVSTLFVLMLFLSISYDGMDFALIGSVVSITAFAMIWLDNIFPLHAGFFRQIGDASLWLLIGAFVYKGVKSLLGKNLIGSEHLSASFALYLLLGIWWGYLYDFLYVSNLDSFSGGHSTQLTLGDFFQYSLSTITTVSTSIISGKSALVRCLGTIEAVCGQFYFAMLIGGLVGSHFSNRRNDSTNINLTSIDIMKSRTIEPTIHIFSSDKL